MQQSILNYLQDPVELNLAIKNIKASQNLEIPERPKLKHWLELMASILSDIISFNDFGKNEE
jgi:hypothetical protein